MFTRNPVPARLVGRLSAQLQATVVGPGGRAFDGGLDDCAIFMLLVSRYYARGTGMSAHSAGASLRQPYETVRRRIGSLVDRGLCERHDREVVPAQAALESPPIAEVLRLVHDSLVRLIADLAMLGAKLQKQREGISYDPRLGMAGAIDILLSLADDHRPTYRDGTALVILSTIFCANVRGHARDPVLAWRYADSRTPLPPGMMIPVRVGAVVRVSGIPENTVRRRVWVLVALGALTPTRRGLIVSEQWLNAPPRVAISESAYYNLKRLLERLAAQGFPFAALESAYLVGRPQDVSFS